MTKDEALKMAIERLEKSNFELDGVGNYTAQIYNEQAIEACKEALKQPTQEPIAHIKQGGTGYPVLIFNGRFQYASLTAKQPDIPLYTHPKKWQGLSDDEINLIYPCTGGEYDFKDIARAIEAKLKELNTK